MLHPRFYIRCNLRVMKNLYIYKTLVLDKCKKFVYNCHMAKCGGGVLNIQISIHCTAKFKKGGDLV